MLPFRAKMSGATQTGYWKWWYAPRSARRFPETGCSNLRVDACPPGPTGCSVGPVRHRQRHPANHLNPRVRNRSGNRGGHLQCCRSPRTSGRLSTDRRLWRPHPYYGCHLLSLFLPAGKFHRSTAGRLTEPEPPPHGVFLSERSTGPLALRSHGE